tara:strand:- start:5624 stop:6001 length:378 start_codon:yes stop_codon:yes gene_type:complete
MATWTVQIPRDQYPSLQVGDKVFYSSPSLTLGGFDTVNESEPLGNVESINNTTSLDDGTKTTTLVINSINANSNPSLNDFLFFKKDETVNMNSLLGYFSKMQFKNNDRSKAELFTASTEINESSK